MASNLNRIENFAESFHHYYSALAPDFDCAGNGESDWHMLPPNERRRFVAATRLALLEAESFPDPSEGTEHARARGAEGRECGC